MAWPLSPTDGMTYVNNLGTTYQYVAADSKWIIKTQNLGVTGIQGVTGLIGQTGAQGFTGPGATGVKGTTGIQGVTGLIGATGAQGFTGPGATGLQGVTGLIGATGIRGADGVAGKLPSSYVELSGATGTTSAVLEDVPTMSTTITLAESTEVSVMSSFQAATLSGSAASTLAIAINVDGTDYDEYQRYLSGSNDKGIGALVHRTGDLSIGSHTIKLRFRRVSGTTTPGLEKADLLAMAMQGAKGVTGVQGFTGLAGTAGQTGPQGVTGAGTAGGGGGYWTTISGSTGSPYFYTGSQMYVADNANALQLDLKLDSGRVISWGHTGGTFQSMVSSAGYTALIGSTGVVWLNTIGDTLLDGLTGAKYGCDKAKQVNFAIPGTQATGTDMAGRFYAPYLIHVFGADAYVSTVGYTGSTTYDINNNGTTMFTTKPALTSGSTGIQGVTADNKTTVAKSNKVTVDIDAANAVAPVDGWVQLYFGPENNKYLP